MHNEIFIDKNSLYLFGILMLGKGGDLMTLEMMDEITHSSEDSLRFRFALHHYQRNHWELCGRLCVHKNTLSRHKTFFSCSKNSNGFFCKTPWTKKKMTRLPLNNKCPGPGGQNGKRLDYFKYLFLCNMLPPQ